MTKPNKRSLGVFSLTCLGLNSVIGSGIFLVPGKIAEHLGPWAPVSFLLGGLIVLPIGLCFAEMARSESHTGGAYRYAHTAFGPEAGFLMGWVMWLSGVIGGATVAVGLGEVVCDLLHTPGAEPSVACLAMAILAAINLSGTRQGALSNELLSITKLLPLVGFVLWAGYTVGPSHMLAPPTPGSCPLDFKQGLLLILYAFSGFEEVPLPAGDVRDPNRTVPRSLMWVLGLSTLFYCLIQGGVSGLGLAGNPTPLQTATAAIPILGPAVVVGSLLCMLSVNASVAFTSPRSLWALADAGWLPRWLAHLHSRRLVPSRCILVNLALSMALACSGSFNWLVGMSVLAALAQHLVTSMAAWKGRQSWLAPNVPMLATAVCLGLLVVCRNDIPGLAELMLIGWVTSWGYRRWAKAG